MTTKPQHWTAVDAYVGMLRAAAETLDQTRRDREALMRALRPFAAAFEELPGATKEHGRELTKNGFYWSDHSAQTVVLVGGRRLTDADFAMAGKVLAEQSESAE